MKASTYLGEKRARKTKKFGRTSKARRGAKQALANKGGDHVISRRQKSREEQQSALDVEDLFMREHGLDRNQARAARVALDSRMEPESTAVQRRALFDQVGAAMREIVEKRGLAQ